MDLKRLGQRAKDLMDKRGGSESLKEDASELRGIAKSPASLKDKAKAAVEAIKEPGDAQPAAPAADAASEAPAAAAASEPERERAQEKVEGEARGKHAHGGHRPGHGRHGHRDEGGDAGGGGPSA